MGWMDGPLFAGGTPDIAAALGTKKYKGRKQPSLAAPQFRFANPRFVPTGSISAPEPTLGARLERGLGDVLMGAGVSPYMANRFAGRTLGFFNDATPVGNVTGADEGGRQFMSGVSRGDLKGAGLGALSFGLSVLPMPGGVKRAAKKAGMFGNLMRDQSGAIRAWHGSPHDFDRFSMDKIGTGEGAQAYGHGLYFAENPDVARSYMSSALSPEKTIATDTLQQFGGDRGAASAWLRKSVKPSIKLEHSPALQAADLLERGYSGNRLYEVNIDANPEDFLDWDAPLKAQPKPVAGALAGLSGLDPERGLLETLDPKRIVYEPDMYGAEVYHRVGTALNGADRIGLVADYNAKQKAMDALRSSGIPGIRYLDQGSRSAGNGTRNYVVFDDKLVNILNKY